MKDWWETVRYFLVWSIIYVLCSISFVALLLNIGSFMIV